MYPRFLGPYRIKGLIDSGGMGEVFKGFDEKLDRDVAIKRIKSKALGNPAAIERFRREAKSAAALSHPAVVQVFHVLEENGNELIVMEYVAGQTLADLVTTEGPLPPSQAVSLFRQLADGLAAAHRRNIIHRDIKSRNLMVTGDGEAKILDFGLAKELESEDSISVSGRLMGTPSSMSPEQARGEPLDPRSDLFSFGVVLYEVITGISPFRGKSQIETLHKVCHYHPIPLSETRLDIPIKLSHLVDSLLAKNPRLRPASADVVFERLNQIGSDEPTILGGGPAPVRRPRLGSAPTLPEHSGLQSREVDISVEPTATRNRKDWFSTRESAAVRSVERRRDLHGLVEEVFDSLSANPIVLLLYQDCHEPEPVITALRHRAAESRRFLHLRLPPGQISRAALFMDLNRQAKFEDRRSRGQLVFEEQLVARETFLLISDFHRAGEETRQALGSTLRAMTEISRHNLWAVLVGGEHLAELKYEHGQDSVLSSAADEIEWPELKVADVARLAESLSVNLSVNRQEELLAATGGDARLVREVLRRRRRQGDLPWDELLPETLECSSVLAALWTPLRRLPAQEQERIQTALQTESPAPYRPWPADVLWRRLFWCGALKIQDRRFRWRSKAAVCAGLEILGEAEGLS